MVRSSQVVPLRENPVRRIRHAHGLTLERASIEAGCHLQVVFLQEQGVYESIVPVIEAWLIHKTSWEDVAGFQNEYLLFQQEKRKAHGEVFGLPQYSLGPPTSLNPIVQLRQDLGLSRMGFAKRFCVHPALLHRAETGGSDSLPGQLVAALLYAGMRADVIEELAFRVEEW